MHYSRHRLSASATNELALLAYWSVRQKLISVSSVQLRRSVRAFEYETAQDRFPHSSFYN